MAVRSVARSGWQGSFPLRPAPARLFPGRQRTVPSQLTARSWLCSRVRQRLAVCRGGSRCPACPARQQEGHFSNSGGGVERLSGRVRARCVRVGERGVGQRCRARAPASAGWKMLAASVCRAAARVGREIRRGAGKLFSKPRVVPGALLRCLGGACEGTSGIRLPLAEEEPHARRLTLDRSVPGTPGTKRWAWAAGRGELCGELGKAGRSGAAAALPGPGSGLAARGSRCHSPLCHECRGTGEEAAGPETGAGNGLRSVF